MMKDAQRSVLQSSMSPCLPLLVFHHRNGGDNVVDDNDDEMLMFSLSQQSLHKNLEHDLLAAGSAKCWPTTQGWMLLAEKDHDDTSPSSPACLWNPLTGERLPLPNIGLEENEIPRFCKCFLTHKDPSHPGCAVVLFHLAAPVLWYCHVAHGGSGWRRHAYDIGNYPIPEAYRRPTKAIISIIASFQGKLYFFKSPREMCAIDFSPARAQPTFQFFDVHRSARYPQAMSSGRDWLVDSQDQLFLVSVRFIGFDPDNIGAIYVYRMDFSSSKRARWISVRDIGDVVFLLEDANVAASCPASALGHNANQIYFMKNLKEDDADLCVFDLESNSHEITRVHQHDDLILRRKPFWIVPPN